jgi:hypothetical protein
VRQPNAEIWSGKQHAVEWACNGTLVDGCMQNQQWRQQICAEAVCDVADALLCMVIIVLLLLCCGHSACISFYILMFNCCARSRAASYRLPLQREVVYNV